MSHVSVVELEVKDLAALKEACEAIGLEFVEGQTSFKWYGRWMNDYDAHDAAYRRGIDPKNYGRCKHAIRIPGDSKAYEVGVVAKQDGSGYELCWDSWSGGFGLQAYVGKDCENLKHEYAKVTVKKSVSKSMKKWGFRLAREEFDKTTGETKLTLKRYN